MIPDQSDMALTLLFMCGLMFLVISISFMTGFAVFDIAKSIRLILRNKNKLAKSSKFIKWSLSFTITSLYIDFVRIHLTDGILSNHLTWVVNFSLALGSSFLITWIVTCFPKLKLILRTIDNREISKRIPNLKPKAIFLLPTLTMAQGTLATYAIYYTKLSPQTFDITLFIALILNFAFSLTCIYKWNNNPN